jgi:hypothetical protein
VSVIGVVMDGWEGPRQDWGSLVLVVEANSTGRDHSTRLLLIEAVNDLA